MSDILQWVWSLPQEPHGCRVPTGLAGDQGVLAAGCHLTAAATTPGHRLEPLSLLSSKLKEMV